MILYFADRYLNILGQASTELPKGLTVSDDLKKEDVETGVASFECYLPFDKYTRAKVKECGTVGNYILRSNDNEKEFYTIIDSEGNSKSQERYIYAEDAGLDLLNEVVGAYEADKAYNIAHYVNKYISGSGFVIGINEVSNLTRKLSWDGESTVTERLASIATQFDGCEISYSFDIEGLNVLKMYVNIHKKRGQDIGAQLRLNQDVDRIVTKESIANLATALQCTGGTPEDAEKPITLKGYSYDDGDFYVDGDVLKSRNALKKWERNIWLKGKTGEGHIVKQYEYDTTSQKTLCSHAITELKKLCEVEVNYEVDFSKLPENAKVGDRVNIIDDADELYLSTRLLKIETSVTGQKKTVTLGEHLIKESGINQKVIELAAKFAQTSQSASRAKVIAQNASAAAKAAQEQANSALTDAENAKTAAQEAAQSAANALNSAETAQNAAQEAQTAVNNVEKSVENIEATVNNAQTAANNAHQAAESAKEAANESAQSAANAKADAANASAAVKVAQSAAETATTKAGEAKETAETAKSEAETAKLTAQAAKQDAAKAQEEIDSFEDELDTVTRTMEASYARKTELTEAEANLQSQITQNANELSSSVSKIQRIDETTNEAYKLLEGALAYAEKAQEAAAQAALEAEAAQTAADEAAQAAENAQSEADTARTAAETAQSVADKAEADLLAAKADLETVQSRADATEEEIAAAQEAVENATQAAATAKADCITANGALEAAQAKAEAAYLKAQSAQNAANTAASNATLAQKTADEANGAAEAAQAIADEAAEIANEAQRTASEAVATAEAAKTAADEAAEIAEAAEVAANTAQDIVTQSSADLLTAQRHLEEVLSNVEATEEEITAAETAVETAQAAVNEAQTNAEAAEAAATEATEAAEVAQNEADTAMIAAEEAQTAARNAQFAADEASKEVNGLAVRMTSAEAKIHQNAEQIALRATKEEVKETLGGYYTKKETKAEIEITSESIKNTVSATYTTKNEVAQVETIIQQLADSIASLVRDGNGGSLIRQDENGLWYFNIGGIEQNISNTANELDSLSGIVLDANGQIDVLKTTAAALQERTEYVRSYTDENGQPCLELGEGDSAFKVRITNTEIQFADGTSVPAKLSRKMLVIEKAMVKQELQFGDDEEVDGVWIWKRRSNGNLGLFWKEVNS